MSKLLRYGFLPVLVTLLVVFWWWNRNDIDVSKLTTATVERGTVAQLVSVSGFVEADNTAELGFPAAGRISDVYISEGQTVRAGELLATIGQNRLAAERRAALANLDKALATRLELQNGQTNEERAVTDSTVAQARAAWEQTVATELQKVKNAEVALRSNDLAAYSDDPDEEAPAPVVTGSYTCAAEGTYEVDFYRSGTDSGYSIRYTELEEGTSAASVDQPVSFGECGLSLQITEDESYANSEWTIPVPNTRSNTYITYVNALALAEQQATENIQAAKDALAIAENTSVRDTAAPRVEALIVANANVNAAQAELARIDALLSDQSVYAPFAGTITNIEKRAGEVATTEPFITLLAQDAFTLIARIPEIDIRKLYVGQKIIATFDASQEEPLAGAVSFINPIAIEIDGVAYFETKVELVENPEWLRAGLNADIEVEIETRENVLVLPQRFIKRTEDGTYVTVLEGKKLREVAVETALTGTDGLVEINNLTQGLVVVAP